MRSGKTGIAALVLAASLAPAPAPSAPAASPASVAAPDPVAAARLEDLVRLWYFARLFHPDLAGSTEGWDADLVAAVPAALAAGDDKAFAAVANAMLARLDNSFAYPPGGAAAPVSTHQAGAAPPSTQAFRTEAGTVIASCVGLAGLPSQAALRAAIQPVAATIGTNGLVIDCRHFPQDGSRYQLGGRAQAWIMGAIGSTLVGSIAIGGRKMRFHDGYPTERGMSSGGYLQGDVTVALPPVVGTASPTHAGAKPRLALIVDSTTPEAWSIAGAVQSAGRGRVVVQGSLLEGRHNLAFQHVAATIKVAEYVDASGRAGFRPDACTESGDDRKSLETAIALLDPAVAPPGCANPRSAQPAGPAASRDGDKAELPDVGERVLALAKLWGGIEYFYSYKSLLDRPWEAQLHAFMPAFLGADDRAAYERAVIGLAHELQDTHVNVAGQRSSFQARNGWAPSLYVRPVGKSFAILAITDPALRAQVNPGDEIVAIDGLPTAEVAAARSSNISASTPQSLASSIAPALLAGPRDSEARLTLRRAGGKLVELRAKRSQNAFQAAIRPYDAPSPWRRLAPDIGYVDLEHLSAAEADKAIDALLDTRAIIFDLRGYPQGTAWVIAPRLAAPGRDLAVAAAFRRPHYVGAGDPGDTFTSFEQRLPPTDKPHYLGRVIVLIDARAISQSEHTGLFFKAAREVLFVGTPTTGANGDVTVIALPGDLWVSFTGHDVRWPDGRQLQRVGIQPDVRIEPTLKGIAAGRDEVLEAGLKLARRK